MTSPRILIVGGGIGGLTLAHALQRQGVPSLVVEQAAEWRPIGAGIVLGLNAMALLESLGLAPRLHAVGQAIAVMTIADAQGRPLQRFDMAAVGRRYRPSLAVHRADLHQALLADLPADGLRLATTVERLTETPEGMAVRFSDGSEDVFDRVIGADGLRSRVRQLTFGPQEPVYLGYTSWRFVIPQPEPLDGPIEMWGRGHRLGLVPLADGRVYGFTTQNVADPAGDDPETRIARFQSAFGGFGGPARAVVRQIREPGQLIHTAIAEVHCARWVRGRVALLGDAAHALSPNLGQGAAMAIEDACHLAAALTGGSAADRAMQHYERTRQARVCRVQTLSRRLGWVGQWESALACRLRDRLLLASSDQQATERMATLLLDDPLVREAMAAPVEDRQGGLVQV